MNYKKYSNCCKRYSNCSKMCKSCDNLNSLKFLLNKNDLSSIDGELYLELLSIKTSNYEYCSNNLAPSSPHTPLAQTPSPPCTVPPRPPTHPCAPSPPPPPPILSSASQQLEPTCDDNVQIIPFTFVSREIIKNHIKEKKNINAFYYNQNSIVKNQTVDNYILKILEEDDDIDIDLDYFGITEDYEMEIKNAIKKVGINRLKPIKKLVNKNITWLQIKICILVIKIEEEKRN